MLAGAAIGYTSETTPQGCLLASGSAASCDVQRAVAEIRGFFLERLRRRIERDVSVGVLPATTNAAALAGMVMTVMQGLSVLAVTGSAGHPCRPSP